MSDRRPPKATSTLKTVDKALYALDFLGVFGGQVGVRELAEYLGIDKSSTHRLLTTLERHDYVAQDPITGKYQLGGRVFQHAAVVFDQMNLRLVARPHLEQVAAASGEVVHLAVVNGHHCVYVDKLCGPNAIPMASQIGWRKPLHCTGIGKALLAHLPEAIQARAVRDQPFEAFTPNTIVDPDRLRAELAEIRASGVAFDREEIEVGLCCVAAPVWGTHGQVVAGISVAGPAARFGPDHLPHLTELVRRAARAIAADLSQARARAAGPETPQHGT